MASLPFVGLDPGVNCLHGNLHARTADQPQLTSNLLRRPFQPEFAQDEFFEGSIIEFPGQLAGMTPPTGFAVGFDRRIFSRGIHVATQLSRDGAGVAIQFTGEAARECPKACI